MDTSNNDAIHGDEYFIDVTPGQERIARRQYLTALQKVGFDGRKEAEEYLSDNDDFWDAIFSIGASYIGDDIDYNKMILSSITLSTLVEISVLRGIQDLSEVI